MSAVSRRSRIDFAGTEDVADRHEALVRMLYREFGGVSVDEPAEYGRAIVREHVDLGLSWLAPWLVFAFVVWFIFSRGLQLSLPAGPLERLLTTGAL